MGNCLVGCGLTIFWCRSGCSKQKITSMAYHPPKKSYRIIKITSQEPATDGESTAAASSVATAQRSLRPFQILFEDPSIRRSVDSIGGLENVVPMRIDTKSNSSITALFVPYELGGMTILYSHGNAVDIGQMLPTFMILAKELRANIFGYEYTGYGDSEGGPPNEKQTYMDVEAALGKLIEMGIPVSQIILYGQSIGSGPTCHLAGRAKVAGVIIHSGLISGINVIRPPSNANCCCLGNCCSPSCTLGPCDVYKNSSKIHKFDCPVYLIHGTKDEVIDKVHAEVLHRNCSNKAKTPPLFIENAGHNDVVDTDPNAYFEGVRNFIRNCQPVDSVSTKYSQLQ